MPKEDTMDTPSPTPTTPGAPPVAAEQPLVYRPLSMLAIFSVVAGGLYTALILITGCAALMQGTPIYLPTWALAVPLGGALLAFAAGWRIRGSEGTLAGMPLANWGWWLSIISGLGYAAFYGATALAVQQQADHFLRVEGPESGFFPLLQKGKINEAFLLTQPASRRESVNPNDPAAMEVYDIPAGGKTLKGILSMFRFSDLVKMLVEAGDQAQVKALGVKEWKFDNKGFSIQRGYRITMPEAELDVLLTAQSTEGGGASPGRKWFVVFFPPPKKEALNLTELGRLMTAYRLRGKAFIKAWADKINLNLYPARVQSFFETQSPETRERSQRVASCAIDVRLATEALIQLGQAPGSGLPLGCTGPLIGQDDYDYYLYLPGYADFASGRGIDVTNWESLARDDGLRNQIRTQVLDSFFGRVHPGRPPITLKGPDEAYMPYRKKDGKVQILAEFDMPVGMTPQDVAPKYLAECVITAEVAEVSGEAINMQSYNDWRIVSIELKRLLQLPQGIMKVDPNQPMPKRTGGPVR
jgi:hypothetical protein